MPGPVAPGVVPAELPLFETVRCGALDGVPPDSILRTLHPAVASWFVKRFPSGPTDPQRSAWPSIIAGGNVLVASPTGTGKTLTGFLMAIDGAYRAHAEGPAVPVAPRTGPTVVYVSPLRALATDVHENLQVPLAGIAEEAERLGLGAPDLSVAVRTGDTPAADRAAMRRSPPDLLVTTPESLYLLLTAASSRSMLQGVRTVIVDEVHTLARDKRGSHLALTLERLDHVVSAGGGRLQRIGLSATQRPLAVVARLLSGSDPSRPPTTVVDCGHRRDLDVAIELPHTELEAVTSGGQLSDVLDRIAAHVLDHRTTLVFVNTRKMAERVAHQLALRLGAPDDGSSGDAGGPGAGDRIDAALQVAAHHGSLSPARRRIVEQRLRAGDLRALVATASLELGIDVGPVELVCQIGSPRAIGTFLQRVGRANHQLEGTPAGRLFPLTRDELVECTALLAGVRAGHLDVLEPPVAPLDVLAQQVVAEVAAADEWEVEPLYRLIDPGRTLCRPDSRHLRRSRRSGFVGDPHRSGPAGSPPPSRRGQRKAPGPTRCPPGRADQWRCHSRDRGLPGGPRSRRGHRRLRRTRTSRSRPPPATSFSWAPIRGGWPRSRPARCASTTPATCPRPSRSGSGRRRPGRPSCPKRWDGSGPRSSPFWLPGTWSGPDRRPAGGRVSPTRSPIRWPPTSGPGWPPSGGSRPVTASSSSGSSTRARAPS